ncbi:hypothetical protein A2U01_0049844 [Trifolium medium]|uniref:Uncharacterized protein n=1 Tax=Trifolium medium TaxID=97028 RepID=A0A392QXP0_9FABA|nr:hypothetical protein [Trifolium medium]
MMQQKLSLIEEYKVEIRSILYSRQRRKRSSELVAKMKTKAMGDDWSLYKVEIRSVLHSRRRWKRSPELVVKMETTAMGDDWSLR